MVESGVARWGRAVTTRRRLIKRVARAVAGQLRDVYDTTTDRDQAAKLREAHRAVADAFEHLDRRFDWYGFVRAVEATSWQREAVEIEWFDWGPGSGPDGTWRPGYLVEADDQLVTVIDKATMQRVSKAPNNIREIEEQP